MQNSKFGTAFSRKLSTLFVGLMIGWTILPQAARADAQADELAKLRSALREATSQLRQLQDQNATLTTQVDQANKQREEAANQLKTAQDEAKKAQSDHSETDRARAALGQAQSQLAKTQQGYQTQQENLEKWKSAYQDAVTVAKGKAQEAAINQANLDQSTKNLDYCIDKNIELYKVGNEALDLYDKKDVSDELLQEEPVTQIKRVEIENLIQTYQDKLRDAKIDPSGVNIVPAQAAPPAATTGSNSGDAKTGETKSGPGPSSTSANPTSAPSAPTSSSPRSGPSTGG